MDVTTQIFSMVRLGHMMALATTFSALLDSNFNYYKLAEFRDDGDRWTLHGLWAERSADDWPEFCSGPAFNETALLPLEPKLQHDWPNYHGSALALHRHEYNKHGKCTGLTELEYFTRTLDAYERYGLNGLSRRTEELGREFHSKYGTALTIDHRRHGRASEVSFCMDKEWVLMDCPLPSV